MTISHTHYGKDYASHPKVSRKFQNLVTGAQIRNSSSSGKQCFGCETTDSTEGPQGPFVGLKKRFPFALLSLGYANKIKNRELKAAYFAKISIRQLQSKDAAPEGGAGERGRADPSGSRAPVEMNFSESIG